jgi:hypothetical protein
MKVRATAKTITKMMPTRTEAPFQTEEQKNLEFKDIENEKKERKTFNPVEVSFAISGISDSDNDTDDGQQDQHVKYRLSMALPKKLKFSLWQWKTQFILSKPFFFYVLKKKKGDHQTWAKIFSISLLSLLLLSFFLLTISHVR